MTDLTATEQRPLPPQGQPIYATNAWWVFAGICFIYLFFNWYLQTQVLTDEVYHYSLEGRIGAEKLGAFLDGQHRMRFFSYLLVPVSLLVRLLLVSFCLLTGLLLTSAPRKLAFRDLFRIVLFAESAFAASILFKLLLLAFFHNIDSISQFESFAPLSLFSLTKASSVPLWLAYPLQTLDVFQLVYIGLLAAGLRHFLRLPFRTALMLVLGTYGTGLLCWIIGLAFLTVSFNP